MLWLPCNQRPQFEKRRASLPLLQHTGNRSGSQTRGNYNVGVLSTHKKRGTLRSPFESDLSISAPNRPGKLEQTYDFTGPAENLADCWRYFRIMDSI